MSQLKRQLPIGLQTFSTMIEEDFIYIDKTEYIHNLVKAGRYYFLSRPRRFGKSLLISTLEELFSGNKKLFSSLYINSTDYAWQEHPVIVISFASMASESQKALKNDIIWTLNNIAARYGVTIDDAPSLSTKFKSLILKLAVKNKVVVLVDEYDYTILQNIENYKLAYACRTVLRDLFSALKDIEVDKHIRFVFITGISKFSKTSIFSGLNNLQDLTLDPRATQLLGYTTQEIRNSYDAYLTPLSRNAGNSVDDIMEQVRFWYNGYQFCDPTAVKESKVYNPYSVMLYLQSGVFDNYWFDTGTPSFLMRLIKAQDYPIEKIDGSEIHISQTKSYEIKDLQLIPLLWQTGYLTVKSYNSDTKNYTLTFPDEEVKVSFFEHIMRALTQVDAALLSSTLSKLSHAANSADLETFFTTLKILFSQIPYDLHLPAEKYYQTIFFNIMNLLGHEVKAEERTNDGRIDAVIETKTHILLFEFKLDESARAALDQIEEKKYYQKYLLSGKTILLIGVQFEIEKRNITQWLVKELPSK